MLTAMQIMRCFLIAAALAGAVRTGLADEAETRPLVYVIPIRGMIEPALLYVVRRGVAEAERERADAVVFVMDTPGGTVNAAREIVFTIQNVKVPTYTWVEKDAFSAGAIIALATRHIYMAPGSVIGDAMPIMVSPFGGVQEMPEGAEEKTVSAVAALIRAAAEQGGHNKELAEAMVRRDIEYKLGERVVSPAGQLLTLTNVEAAELIGEDGGPLLSEGTVGSVEELLEKIGKADAEVRELSVTGAERIARLIAALGPLLLMAGLLGVYIEVRTPGFGLPGILGIILLAVFFWGHHVAGLAGSEDLLLFIVGLALLAVELLFIPDFGLVGLLGLGMMLLGLLMAMVQRYPGGPLLPSAQRMLEPAVKLAVALVGTVVGAAIVGRYLPQSRAFRHLMLETATDKASGYSASDDQGNLLGLVGKTVTALRPGGAARLEGRRVDVVTRGEFIDAGRAVRVAETHGSRIVVEAAPVGTGGSETA